MSTMARQAGPTSTDHPPATVRADQEESPVQFSLLYRYDADGPGPLESDIDAWMKFSADLEAAGALVHETGFFPASQAVSVTVDADGNPIRSPGAQPGEPISGYYTIEVADLDEAIEWAAKVPVAGKGTVEVRQVVELD